MENTNIENYNPCPECESFEREIKRLYTPSQVKDIINDCIIEAAKIVYENPANCITNTQIEVLKLEDKILSKWMKK